SHRRATYLAFSRYVPTAFFHSKSLSPSSGIALRIFFSQIVIEPASISSRRSTDSILLSTDGVTVSSNCWNPAIKRLAASKTRRGLPVFTQFLYRNRHRPVALDPR